MRMFASAFCNCTSRRTPNVHSRISQCRRTTSRFDTEYYPRRHPLHSIHRPMRHTSNAPPPQPSLSNRALCEEKLFFLTTVLSLRYKARVLTTPLHPSLQCKPSLDGRPEVLQAGHRRKLPDMFQLPPPFVVLGARHPILDPHQLLQDPDVLLLIEDPLRIPVVRPESS